MCYLTFVSQYLEKQGTLPMISNVVVSSFMPKISVKFNTNFLVTNTNSTSSKLVKLPYLYYLALNRNLLIPKNDIFHFLALTG